MGGVMSCNDREYFIRRATHERAMAYAATSAEVAAIHQQLAESYEELLRDAKRPTLYLSTERAT